MKKYILSLLTAALLTSCADKLEVTPPNSITDEQIRELLASGNEASIKLVLGSMANSMPLLFNFAGINGSGSADVYYSNQGLDVMRTLEGNDVVLGDGNGISGVSGSTEYQFGNFISSAVDKNAAYWYYAWNSVNAANKMLNFLDDKTVGNSTYLKDYKARGLVVRAYAYNYLMENYQDAYLQGGNGKLGIMLYDSYAPTQASRPRATATETYDFIKNDLKSAIKLFEEANIGFTNDVSDIDLGVANFLLARASVWSGDWATANAAYCKRKIMVVKIQEQKKIQFYFQKQTVS
jgi:hypothetical protein